MNFTSTNPRGGPEPPALAERWVRLWCHTTRWQRSMDQLLSRWKLRYSQYVLLSIIDRLERETGNGVIQQTLSQETGLGRSRVSQNVVALERRNLVDRGPDGLDARMWSLRLTKEGSRLIAEIGAEVEQFAVAYSVKLT